LYCFNTGADEHRTAWEEKLWLRANTEGLDISFAELERTFFSGKKVP